MRLDLRPTGEIGLPGGIVLRPPTFGELRRICEANDRRLDADVAALAGTRSLDALLDGLAGRLGLWREIAQILDVTLPTIDDLPPALGHPNLLVEAIEHWCQKPYPGPWSRGSGSGEPVERSLVEAMFAPVYSAAAQAGIAPSLLDQSPPHVIRWALEGEKDPNAPETADDVRAAYLERQRLEQQGRLDEFYRPDNVNPLGAST